jgi:AAA+ ATPase superfamily predicted ATPase
MTAGFPAVAKELDPERSYEENLRILLAYDSGFSTYLPQLVRESFRSPESYYPIIAGIARGKHRLSEIAKEAGFPNNKCGTYLDALIKAGFVREEKDGSGPWARYYLANSYYIAWGRYVYGKQNLQLVMPDTFLQIVSESLDEAVALPGLHAACLRYVTAAYEEKFLYDSIDFEIEPEQIKRSVLTELEDGSTVTIDYYASMEGDSIFAIFPHALSERFGKEEYERIEDAVKRHEGLNTACIFLFSVHRFSDWIVHRVARNPLRYAVTLERLKY